MHILASQTRRLSDQHAIKGCRANVVAQAIEAGAAETGPTVAIIPKNVLLTPGPSLCLTVGSQLCQLLLNGLRLCLPLRRHPHIDCHAHHTPPVAWFLAHRDQILARGEPLDSTG